MISFRIPSPPTEAVTPLEGEWRKQPFLRMLAFLAVVAALTGTRMEGAEPAALRKLERVRYNHPGLRVDLGVGLYAFPLPLDWDGDRDLDLVVTCPDRPYNGTYLFENKEGRKRMPAFEPARRLGPGPAQATLSWVDGTPRVLAGRREFTNFMQGDFQKARMVYPTDALVPIQHRRANAWRFVDYDGDGASDLLVGQDSWDDFGWFSENDWWKKYDANGRWTGALPRGWVFWIRNDGTDAAPRWAAPRQIEAGGQLIETAGWPAPNLADFDRDGDLDLICGEFLDQLTWFENIGTRRKPVFAAGRRLTHRGSPIALDLEMIFPQAVDWNGDGDVDLLVGDEDGRVALLENTGRVRNRVPQFLPPRYFQQKADELKFGALATPCGFDWDGDGDIDLLSGNTAGHIGYFENLSGPRVARPRFAAPKLLEAGGETIRIMAGTNGSIQGPIEAKWGYTVISVADWDNDGLPDIVANSIWGKVIWYRNVGSRRRPRLAPPKAIEVEWTGAAPKPEWNWWSPEGKELVTPWRTTPFAIDWNRDGLTDLVMLDPEGYLAFYERASRHGANTSPARLPAPRTAKGAGREPERTARARITSSSNDLILLPPRRVFADEKGEPLRLNAGAGGRSGRRKFCLVDWDGDGRLDLLLNSRNANFLRQVGRHGGQWLFKDEGPLAADNIEAHDVSPTTVDWDGNGVPDFLGGAEDGRFYFLENRRALTP